MYLTVKSKDVHCQRLLFVHEEKHFDARAQQNPVLPEHWNIFMHIAMVKNITWKTKKLRIGWKVDDQYVNMVEVREERSASGCVLLVKIRD